MLLRAYGRSDHRNHADGNSIVVVLIILLIAGGAVAAWKMGGGRGKLDGWLHDIDSGIAASDASGKPMLVLFTADWCPPCRQLKKQVLTDSEVATYLKQEYVTVKIDLTDRASPNNYVAQEYGVRVIPTMFVFGMDGREIASGGAQAKSQFLNWVKSCKAQASGV